MPITFIPYVTTQSSTQRVNVHVGGLSRLQRMPLHGLYNFSQSGMIYLASELSKVGIQAGSMIDAIELEFDSWAPGYRADSQSIRMAHTPSSAFPDPAEPSYADIGVDARMMTVVKDGFTYTHSADGWTKFDFATPFIWDGANNILISWENRDGAWEDGYGYLLGDGVKSRSHNWFEDRSYPELPSSYANGKANLRLWCDKVGPIKEEGEPGRR